MVVYKFKSVAHNIEHTLDILLNSRVYASDWTEFNDPMEGYFRYTDEELSNKIVNNKKNYRIACFSKYYSNALQWSYYSDGFSGICIAIKIKDREFPLTPVNYCQSIPWIDEKSAKSPEELAKLALTTKLIYWEHESEIRSLIPVNKLNEGKYLPCLSIKAVLYGNKIDDVVLGLLKAICDSKSIPLYEVALLSDPIMVDCSGVSTNVRLADPHPLIQGWLEEGLGPLSGWLHPEVKCQLCDFQEDDNSSNNTNRILETHYIVPTANGGSTDPHNIALLCPTCHKREHMDPTYRDELLEANKSNR